MVNRTFSIVCCCLVVFGVLMFGCQKQADEANDFPLIEDIPDQQPNTDPVDEPVSPIIEPSDPTDESVDPLENQQPKEDEPDANEPQHRYSDDSGAIQEAMEEPVVTPSQRQWTLFGLSLYENKAQVTNKFGTPVAEFPMEDNGEMITVFDYDHFMVGFNPQNQIIFINVISSHVDPQLNGVKIGDRVEKAISALGNPTTNTEYVISYISSTSILKLDIDPQTQTIRSISLFEP